MGWGGSVVARWTGNVVRGKHSVWAIGFWVRYFFNPLTESSGILDAGY